MNPTGYQRKIYRMILAVTLLALFVAAQCGPLVRTAQGIFLHEEQEESTYVDPSLRTWIYEDNGAEEIVFFYERTELQRFPGLGSDRSDQEEALWMLSAFAVLLLGLLLTVSLETRRRFIRQMEQDAVVRRSGCVLMRVVHRSDGEKEAGYNFLIA